ncbi:hypothetical protein RhiirB3_460215 [Rhizophagus irregularis]|nr:hypothetical protein RhiirB3_460215 [Rhizophagus irregularis]
MNRIVVVLFFYFVSIYGQASLYLFLRHSQATFKADLKLEICHLLILYPLHDTGTQFILRPLESTYFYGGLLTGNINYLILFHTTILGTRSHSKATTACDYLALIVHT